MKKLAIFLVGLITACSGITLFKGSTTQPLITIGNEEVLADEFTYAFNKNRSADSTNTKKDIDDYLELYINFKLKVLEAKKRGMDTTQAFKKEYNSYINQLDNSYLKTSNDTDSLVRQAFDRLQYEIRASHILITVEASALPKDTLAAFNKALALRDSLENGASFEKIAVAYSQDPSAKQNKGDLGYFTVLQMVYPFETAAYTTPVGKISMPIRSKFGYHLIKVTGKRPNEGKVRVAHIMIRTSDSAHDNIVDIYDQLQAGADWDKTCQKYSEDPQSAAKGGILVPFSRGQIVAEFADAAFALTTPEEISDPVQTAYGWHIIKLITRLPVTDFAANEDQLRAKVRRDSRSQISRQKMLARLAKDNNWQENTTNVQRIINPKNHLFVKNKWAFNQDSLANTQLFSIKDSAYYANSYYTLISKTTTHQNSEAFLFEMYKKFKEESLIAYEKAHLAEKYDDYKYLKKEYHDGILLFSIMENEVWTKASNDSLGLTQYYEQHKNAFIDSTKIGAIIFSSPKRATIDSITTVFPDANSVKKLSFTEKQALLRDNNQDSQLSLQIESGEFVLNKHAVLQKLALPYTDSLFQMEDKWYYVIILRSPDQPMPLAEVRGKIIADYQEVLENKWLEQLKNKYLVKINQSVLNTVYKELEVQ